MNGRISLETNGGYLQVHVLNNPQCGEAGERWVSMRSYLRKEQSLNSRECLGRPGPARLSPLINREGVAEAAVGVTRVRWEVEGIKPFFTDPEWIFTAKLGPERNQKCYFSH